MKRTVVFVLIFAAVLLLASCKKTEGSAVTDEFKEYTVVTNTDISAYTFDDIEELINDDYSGGGAQHNEKIAAAIDLVKVRIDETYRAILEKMDGYYENDFINYYSREVFDEKMVIPFKKYYSEQMNALEYADGAATALSSLIYRGGTAGSGAALSEVYSQYRAFLDWLVSYESSL